MLSLFWQDHSVSLSLSLSHTLIPTHHTHPLTWPLWNEIFPATSVGKNVTPICDFGPLNMNESSPDTINACDTAPATAPHSDCRGAPGQGRKQEAVAHHTSATPEGTEDVNKKQDLTPDSWGAYERSEFSKPRDLHLPKHRKTLNSFAWYLVFLT